MKNILALEASAGSGKTFALSVRYIALLFLGANPSSIVALTFTKKAANEMKERIYETLLHLEAKKAELGAICELLDKSQEEVLELCPKVMSKFLHASLHVETIDAFFGKILRKFSLHLGLMPDFQTASSSNQAKLEYEFVKTIKKDKKALNSLIHFMLNEKRKFRSLFELFEILYEKDDNLNNKEFPKTDFPSKQRVEAKAREIVDFLQANNASKTALGMFDVEFSALKDKTFWKYESLNYSTFKKCYAPKLDELFLKLKDEFKEYCNRQEAYLLGELYELFISYKTIKTNLAKQTNELTFSDVTKLTHLLLRQKIESDFLYFRLDSQIEHLLIDEFQDTNVMQFDILKPIVEEIISGIGTSQKSFFYVGDTKQSIFRFRGGSKGLFHLVADEFNIPKEAMDTNYRSDGVVVDFVNETFAPLLENYTNQHVLEKRKNSGYVEVSEYDEVEDGVVASLEKLLQSGVHEDDIAVLCYTNSDIVRIRDAILKWDKSLHVSSQSTKSIFEIQEVQALIEYLKYLYFEYELCGKNTLVLLGKSFTCKLDKIDICWTRPLEESVIKIIEYLKLDGASQDLVRIVEVASEYGDIESFLFDLERLNIPSVTQEAKGIKVLTIHKSKGLEFPCVIVADKIGRDVNRSTTLLYEFVDERLQHIYLRVKNREFVDEMYKNAKEKETKLIQEDRLNVQYVACTRAKNTLFVVKKSKKSSFEPLRLVPNIQGVIQVDTKEKKELKNPFVQLEAIPSFGAQAREHVAEDDREYSLESIYFGRALHYLLELMANFSKESLEDAFWSMKNRYGTLLDKSELEDIRQRVSRLMGDKTFISLVKNGVLHKEKSLVFQGARKQLDLLIEHADRFIIIDYKSSSLEYDENVKQVEFYKKALESIGGKKVEAWLFYLKKEQIVSKSL